MGLLIKAKMRENFSRRIDAFTLAKMKEKNQVMILKLRLVAVWITQIENKIRIQKHELSPRSQMFIIIIFIAITQQPEQDRWAENQPTAGLSSLNENGMRRSKTELTYLIYQ